MIENQDIRLVAIRPSRLLAAAFSLAVALTLAGIVFLSETIIVSVSLCAGMIVLYAWHMQHLLLRAPDSIIGFALYETQAQNEYKLFLKWRDGSLHEAKVIPHSFVTSCVTCVKYRRCEGKWIKRFPRTLLLAVDSLDTEAFRSLRVHLKWG